MNSLQAIASDYARHGLTVIPALPSLKEPAINWKPFQVDPPSELERNALFAEPDLNIGIVGGAVSGNLAMLDAETARAFDAEYERLYRAGLADTWIDRSPSGGGHFYLRLPFPVKSRGKVNDVEIKAQNGYCLAPPSVAPSKIDGLLKPYQFAHRPEQILTVESLDQLYWLNLERTAPPLPFRAYPRKAQKLLQGEWDHNRYETRSELEHAIVTVLVNAGWTFPEILMAFRNNPAAGKFASLQLRDTEQANAWLRSSYNKAREWCASQSPARHNALALLKYAHSIPWRGRSGSSTRAVFVAHCALSYQSGGPTYHASVRDIAELAGCDKNTASTATGRLCAAGAVNLIQRAAFTFARRFSLPHFKDLEQITFGHKEKRKGPKEKRNHSVAFSGEIGIQTNFQTLTIPTCEGVYAVSSVLLPEAFRPRGLGRAAFEVLQALNGGPLSAPQIAERSGRNVQTVRDALKRLKKHRLVAKTSKYWRGRALEDIDLDELSRAVNMRGAAIDQKERHKADRLRHRLRTKLWQTKKANAEITEE